MDPITHGLIGASASHSFAEKEKLRPAALAGFASALLPDLDILIGTASDPLLNLEFHRQFTHSLLFIPVGALIASALLWWIVRKQLTFKETYLFCLIGYGTAGMADTFTSYGVELLWPFLDERFAWNLISVFDPLFSLGLVLGLGFAIYKNQVLFTWLAICWIAIYLLFGFFNREKARSIGQQLAKDRKHSIEQIIVKPTIANNILWSVRYVSNDTLYADGVRLLPFAAPDIYIGESAALLDWQKEFNAFKGTTLYEDIQRFSTLSKGVLVFHPEYENVIGDGRYAMLPTSVNPLWGIEIDTTRPNQHIYFSPYRDAGPEVRKAFKNMLLGKR